MPALTLDALLRSLKKSAPPAPRSGALDPAYLLYGDEDVLKDEAIRALLDAGVPEGRDFNVDTRYAPDLTPESFHALVNTPPMLAERRAVVIRGVEQLGKTQDKVSRRAHWLPGGAQSKHPARPRRDSRRRRRCRARSSHHAGAARALVRGTRSPLDTASGDPTRAHAGTGCGCAPARL